MTDAIGTARGRESAPDGLGLVVERLRARSEEIVAAIYVAVQEVTPSGAGFEDTSYRAGMLAAIGAVVELFLCALEHGPPADAQAPAAAAAQARLAARVGVGLGTVLRRYVAGHRRLGAFVGEELERADLARDAPTLQRVRNAQESLLEALTAAIEGEYERERRRIERSAEQRRLDAVQALLRGEVGAEDRLAGLGYELGGWHLGVIAVGPEACAALQSLRPLGLLLWSRHSERTAWAWLAARRPVAPAEVAALHARAPVRASLALGEPARGVAGWRQTHRQAQDALGVLLADPQPCVRYADVALLAPWLADPHGARALIGLYLAPLDSQRDGGRLSRRTLRAYFAAGRNVSAAARALGVDRRTLASRLEAIEERLGHRLEGQLAEIEVALRLRDLFDGSECTHRRESATRLAGLT